MEDWSSFRLDLRIPQIRQGLNTQALPKCPGSNKYGGAPRYPVRPSAQPGRLFADAMVKLLKTTAEKVNALLTFALRKQEGLRNTSGFPPCAP